MRPWAAVLIFGLMPGAAMGARLDAVHVTREAGQILVDAQLSGSSPLAVRVDAGGLVASVTWSDIDGALPSAPPIGPQGDEALAAVTLTPVSGGRGAVLTLIAKRPLALVAGSRIAFALSPAPAPKVVLAPPPRLEALPSTTLAAVPPPPKAQRPRVAEVSAPTLARAAFQPLPILPPDVVKSSKSKTALSPITLPALTETKLQEGARPGLPRDVGAQDGRVQAAVKGDDRAAVELGTLCLAQKPPDGDCARGWFELAAQRGNAAALYDLAEMARRGLGVARNEAAAVHLLGLAAERQNNLARYRLAVMLLEGRGGPQDVPRARSLLELAALQGHSGARRLLDDLDRNLEGRATTASN